jgi:hypothetical protein
VTISFSKRRWRLHRVAVVEGDECRERVSPGTDGSSSDDVVRPVTKKAPPALIRRDDCRTGVLLISLRCVTKPFRANHAADP